MGILQVLKTQLLCQLIICYVFLVSGFIINLLQLCTLPLWPINKQLARKINCRLGYSISSRKSCKLSRELTSSKEKYWYNQPCGNKFPVFILSALKNKYCEKRQNSNKVLNNIFLRHGDHDYSCLTCLRQIILSHICIVGYTKPKAIISCLKTSVLCWG